ncbi:MAG: mRNA surveillance protein pelota, partial [Candidatus Woesearchaeota archaeon]
AKKTFLAEIVVEKKDFDKSVFQLRVNGKTTHEYEDVPKGSYQTIEIKEGSLITLKKDFWPSYMIKKIEESSNYKGTKNLVLLLDRESAIFALLKKSGYEIILKMEGEVHKKRFDSKNVPDFFEEVAKKMYDYVKRYKISNIIVASPGFWKEYFIKSVKDSSIKRKIITANCNSVSESGLNEVIKSEELLKILKDERVAIESAVVEDILKEIAKNGLVAYGEKEVYEAAQNLNIKVLVITEKFIMKKNEEEMKVLDSIIKNCEEKKTEIYIISSEHESGRKIDGLGGIAALLRFKIYD